jgi:hypothetical protein
LLKTSLMTRTLISTFSTLVKCSYPNPSRIPPDQLQSNATSQTKPTPLSELNMLVKWKRDFSVSWTTSCPNKVLPPSTPPPLKAKRVMLPSTSDFPEPARPHFPLTQRD